MPSRASKFCCLILINMQLPSRHDRVQSPGGGGGYFHIWAIQVCAAVKGIVFKQFTLG